MPCFGINIRETKSNRSTTICESKGKQVRADLRGGVMRKAAAGRPIYREESEEGCMDDRVAKLESDVAHIRTDIVRIEGDVREIRADLKTMRAEIKGEVSGLKVAMERMRSSQRVGFIVLGLMQLLIAGGVPDAIASALRLVKP